MIKDEKTFGELLEESDDKKYHKDIKQIKDPHQVAIAINKAENSMKNLIVAKNKALNAYEKISKK